MSTNSSSNDNSTRLKFQLLNNSSINQSIWEQTQLDADLAQPLDISRVNASDNLAQIDNLTGQLITSQPLTSLSTTNYISNSNNDIDSLNNFTNTLTNNNLILKSSVQPSNTSVSNINNLTQVPFDSKYDIEEGFFVKGGLPNLAPKDIDSVKVDPKRRFIDYELVDNKRGTSGQTWVIIHGWNGDLNQFEDLGEAVKRARPNDTVLVLNWRQAAHTVVGDVEGLIKGANYYAASWIRTVAEGVVNTLTRWGVNPDSLNLIGHSLGAYVAGEIGRVFVEETGKRVNTITALDPANEANSITDSPKKLDTGYYDLNGKADGVLRPVPFSQVSNFSRSFVGRTSSAGSPQNSSTADESIVVDFGNFSGTAGGEHGWIVDVFERMIDPKPAEPKTDKPLPLPRLARNPLVPGGYPHLLSLGDYPGLNDSVDEKFSKVHEEFNQNSYSALRSGRLHEGVISATNTGNNSQQRFFVAADKNNSNNYFIYGTTGNDEILQNLGSNLPSRYYRRGNNTFFGDDGNDRIQASDGNDTIYGGKGNDTLEGSFGNDTLDGVLDGDPSPTFGSGERDSLTGYIGSDKFILGNATSSYYLGKGNKDYALITDFYRDDNLPVGAEIKDFIQLKRYTNSGSGNVWDDLKKDYIIDKPPEELGVSGTAIYRGTPAKADVFFIEDASESFVGSRSIFKACATDLVSKLKDSNPDSMFGLGSFDDYPVSPFGLNQRIETTEHTTANPVYGGYVNIQYYGEGGVGTAVYPTGPNGSTAVYHWASNDIGYGYGVAYVSDLFVGYEYKTVNESTTIDEGNAYVYQTNQSLNIDTNLTLSAFDSVSTQTQADDSEAQSEALLQVANSANSIGFRNDAARFVVMSTDAPYHQYGDGLAAGKSVDYSTIATLKSALTSAKILPIFAVTDNVTSTYQDLVSQLGFGAVVGLSSDSNSLSDVITGNLSSNSSNRDLIGIVQNVTGLDLNSNYFTYI